MCRAVWPASSRCRDGVLVAAPGHLGAATAAAGVQQAVKVRRATAPVVMFGAARLAGTAGAVAYVAAEWRLVCCVHHVLNLAKWALGA